MVVYTHEEFMAKIEKDKQKKGPKKTEKKKNAK